MRHSRVARPSLAAAVLVSLALSLAACRDDGAAERTPSSRPAASEEPGDPKSPEPGVTVASRPCGLLAAEEVADLLGQLVGPGITQAPADGVLTCTFGDLPGRGLQVGAAAASAWAQALPTIAERGRPVFADDPDALERIDRAVRMVESGAGLGDEEACEVFRTIAIANGGASGDEIFVSVFPSGADPEYASAQACRDGVFATLVVSRPDLADTAPQARSLSEALDTVLTRAVEG